MPPKKAKTAPKTTALTRTGPKEVIPHPSKGPKRKEYVEKPTTTRALVLRNGKHGAMGTGEVFMLNKITGKEKLDLLAEDIMEKMRQAVLTPFRLEQCLKIAASKHSEFVDQILELRDPNLFRHIVEREISDATPNGSEARRNATNVAKTVGIKVHNTYMVASAYKLIAETLQSLGEGGVTDTNIKLKLKNDTEVRQRFLVLYDMVKELVKIFHTRVSVLATTSPHYSGYFKGRPTEYNKQGQVPEIGFGLDDKNVRTVTRSFVDCIVMELVLPNSRFPEAVLYQVLQDALQESPNQARRFTAPLYEALGDLSDAVQLQSLIESALLGPNEKAWKAETRDRPEEFEKWLDAVFFSDKATSKIDNWKDKIFPLVSTRKPDVLEGLWRILNLNCKSYSGVDFDTLWQLTDAFETTPQWTAVYIPTLREEDEDEEDGPARVTSGRKKPLALTAGDGYESADSMPDLQSISNSSEEYPSSDEDEDEDEDPQSEDEGYDEEEEDNLRDLLREAMDAAHEVDWYENAKGAATAGIDPLKPDDKKGNPFLNLLGSLRGRFMKTEPKLKPQTQRTEPRSRGGFRATPTGAPKPVPAGGPPKAKPASAQGSQKATMEEVEDEEADGGQAGETTGSKKKKKKKASKKKKSAAPGDDPASPILAPASPPPAPKRAAPAPAAPKSPTAASASASTLHMPIGETQAQSGHSYKKQLESDFQQKAKIKSRPDHASIFSNESESKGKGMNFFSKITNSFKKETPAEPESNKNPKYTWFSRLSKRATESMHQLLRTGEEAGKQPAPMKWDTFVKLMREMGFQYDPSTAGSSVRFDPPDPRDSPITIHKPHPDSTLGPIKLVQIGKRLKRYYGWNEEDFIRQTREATDTEN
ncbi:hypothetical protein EST38_g912 [Candolleomyces aberdarensis]|uniref:Uncharacterized protein n=1 Tax=Candolleomyces aberdarensis TaxID=2316362 RepID=A0A4Q2DYJ5_9AGAR|nr:hypothetical protein EST38_g912 [Candolleomyces aberdarensis]